MLYFAVEQSTVRGSLAAMRGTNVIAERCWDAETGIKQALSVHLADLQTTGELDLAKVDCFVLGTGPGAYTGLRCAAALLSACALPDARQVYAVSSAEVLAWQLGVEHDGQRVMIIGDARGNYLWYKIFRSRGLAPPAAETDWELSDLSSLPWSADMVAATSDWDRIGTELRAAVPPAVNLLANPQFPTAAALARLAVLRMADAVLSDSRQPIYLRGPVKNT